MVSLQAKYISQVCWEHKGMRVFRIIYVNFPHMQFCPRILFFLLSLSEVMHHIALAIFLVRSACFRCRQF